MLLIKFVNGNVNFIIGHPEYILDKMICQILRDKYQDLQHIVVTQTLYIFTHASELIEQRPHNCNNEQAILFKL